MGIRPDIGIRGPEGVWVVDNHNYTATVTLAVTNGALVVQGQTATSPGVTILQGATLSINVGATRQLTVTATGNPTPVVTWGSSATGVATVSATGLVTGISAGSATITATATNSEGVATDTIAVTASVPDLSAEPDWARSTFVGNTFHGWDLIPGTTNHYYIAGSIDAIHVEADGRVFCNALFDERAQNAASYRNGVNKEEVVLRHNNYGALQGGFAVGGNLNYLFYAVSTTHGYPSGSYGMGVARYDRQNQWKAAAGFAGGSGLHGNVLFLKTMNRATHGEGHTPAGIAVTTDRLYVSVLWDNQVRIYNPTTMDFLGSFNVTSPKAVAVGPDGNVWVVSGGGVPRYTTNYGGDTIRRYSATGAYQSVQIAESGASYRGITVDSSNRLWVCDAGPLEQVRRYSSAGVYQASLGVDGGVWEGGSPGTMGHLRMIEPIGVGVDGSSRVYVAMGSKGADLRQYLADGSAGWEVHSRAFLDIASPVPGSDGEDLFSGWYRFTRDNSEPGGADSVCRAVTVQRHTDPGDIRLWHMAGHVSPIAAQTVEGNTYVAMSSQRSGFLAIYHLAGEILRPVAMWSDRNYSQAVFANQPTYGDAEDLGTRQVRSSWVWLNTAASAPAVLPAAQYHWDARADGGTFSHVPGYDFDSTGGVWTTKYSSFAANTQVVGLIRNWRAQGVDAHGNLEYDWDMSATPNAAKFRSWDIPRAQFDLVSRIQYVAETDTLYVSGWSPGTNSPHHILAGNRLCRYDDFTAEQAKHPDAWTLSPTWTMALPYDSTYTHYGLPWKCIQAWRVAGDRVFLGFLTGVEENGVLLSSQHYYSMYVQDAATGAHIDHLRPGPEVGSSISWMDMNHAIDATFDDPNYTVTAEDVWGNKIFVWRGKFED